MSQEQAIERLRELARTPSSQRDPISVFNIGEAVNQTAPIGRPSYGKQLIPKLAREFGKDNPVSGDLLLWMCRRVYIAFDRSEITVLAERAAASNKHGWKLTPLHLDLLASIKDRAARDRLAAECISEAWPVERLRRGVIDLRGKRSSGGAPLAPPSSLEEGLLELVSRSQNWGKRCCGKWFNAPVPGSKRERQRLLDVVEQAEEQLLELEAAILGARENLETIRSEAEK